MKIDRLLGITTYLLNNKRVSATVLAKRFEVSLRTIQRDIDSLCIAGIPVISYHGTQGGYEIQEGFKLENQLVSEQDYSYIFQALQGLTSAYDDPNLEKTLNKFEPYVKNKEKQETILLDFSIVKYDQEINQLIRFLEEVIQQKEWITFEYINASGFLSNQIIVPVVILFKWYTWYVVGYSVPKKSYRLYKLIRMSNVVSAEKEEEIIHPPTPEILKELQNTDWRTIIIGRLRCNKEAKAVLREFLPGTVIEELESGEFIYEFEAADNDPYFFSTLISLENKIEVLEPASLRERMLNVAEEIIKIYK